MCRTPSWLLPVILGAVLAGCSEQPPPAEPAPSASTGSPDGSAAPSSPTSPGGSPTDPALPAAVVCPAVTVRVQTASDLQAALTAAKAGDVIGLADGRYAGNFTATAQASAERPIFLCGSAAAVLDAGGIQEQYVLHLDGATYWRVLGLTVRNGQKGVMADAVQHTVLQGLTVETTGDEAVHLRRGSSDNIIRDSTIRDTGHRRAKFGEGIYLGTAKSNWCTITNCQPDPSNRNVVLHNTIAQTTAESIDIKEGTSDGLVYGNTFDGSSLSGADSWVDVKGSAYRLQANTGAHSPADGFQAHEIVAGAGARNTFADNVGAGLASDNRSGVLIGLHPDRDSVVRCSNRVSDASAPVTNGTCVN